MKTENKSKKWDGIIFWIKEKLFSTSLEIGNFLIFYIHIRKEMPNNIMQSILPIGKKNFDPEKTAS